MFSLLKQQPKVRWPTENSACNVAGTHSTIWSQNFQAFQHWFVMMALLLVKGPLLRSRTNKLTQSNACRMPAPPFLAWILAWWSCEYLLWSSSSNTPEIAWTPHPTVISQPCPTSRFTRLDRDMLAQTHASKLFGIMLGWSCCAVIIIFHFFPLPSFMYHYDSVSMWTLFICACALCFMACIDMYARLKQSVHDKLECAMLVCFIHT